MRQSYSITYALWVFAIVYGLLLTACSAPNDDYPSEPVYESASPPPPAPIEVGGALPPSPPSEPVREPASVQEPDGFKETFETYPIAYETPTSAVKARPFAVTLAVDATGDDDASDALPGRGNITTAQAQLSRLIEPNLSGATFNIKLTSPARQTLSEFTENTWRWQVTPISSGEHDLVLEIFALSEDGNFIPLKTYQDTISVTVAAGERTTWIGENVKLIITTLGATISLILGILALKSQLSRRREEEDD